MESKRNELSEGLLKVVNKFIQSWMKKNPKKDKLYIVQQMNLVSVEIRKLSTKIEEQYKREIGK